MALTPGTRIGPYEITAQIGVGGMGEVYRASDTNLKRQVAIKVLPTSLAGDAERLVRFQREAEILAALNHPNIAQIHGLEKSDGTIALVMELVEGPTLADLIAGQPGGPEGPPLRTSGPGTSASVRRGGSSDPPAGLPLDETLAIARQITAALERAHEQGIVHRDLKPANIKVRPDGTVKVLDFGLAKAMESHAVGRGFSPAGDAGSKDPAYIPLSQAPTITSPALMTGAGMILGTAAYMSPEQAKGRPADRRSDLWSFGCVLYEMLTGRRLFDGDDMSEVMADVIKGQVSFDALPANTPPGLRRLLQRCLRKDPAQRLDSAVAARIELEELDSVAPAATPVVKHDVGRMKLGLAVAVALSATIAAAVTWLVSRGVQTSAPTEVTRFEINPPPGLGFPGASLIPRFAVSPDGRSVAVEAGPPGVGPFHLWVRRFDQIEGRPLQGTAAAVEVGVQGPFWFPNGEMVGFFDESAHQLKTVSLLNDQVRTLADVPVNQYGGAANRDGVIIFSSIASSGIMRVPASGGTPQQVTTLAQGEVAHLWPAFLPDGNHFVYLAVTENRKDWAVFLGSLDGQPSRRLVEADSMAQLAAPDRLLFVRGDSLFAQRLDVSTNQLVGDPLLVAQPISVTAQGRAAFSVSASGTLVHASGAGLGAERDPTWVDRNGREEPMGLPRRRYSQVRLSPDGTKIALTVADIERDLWLWSFSAKTLTRLTSGAGAGSPAWTPDSNRIAYSSGSTGLSTLGLFIASADGSAKPDKLAPNGTPSTITADGTALLMDGADQSTAGYTDVYRLPLVGSRERQLLLGGPLSQSRASVSPDGRWVAYQGGESGRSEIVVRPFPEIDSGQWQVSTMGGTQPVWSRDGRELFYVSLDLTLMSVKVGSGPAWTGGTPIPLFSSTNLFTGLVALNATRATYDVTADGRFVILKASATLDRPLSASLVVVTNWQQELAPASVK